MHCDTCNMDPHHTSLPNTVLCSVRSPRCCENVDNTFIGQGLLYLYGHSRYAMDPLCSGIL